MIARMLDRAKRRMDLRRLRSDEDGSDGGFTLVELLIAIVLSGVISGVVVAALATSMNVASATTKMVGDSTDAGLISAFLFRDAQAAGATDPATMQADPTVGVSTSASDPVWLACAQPGNLVVRFSWLDRQAGQTPRRPVATYALDSAGQLTRRLCENGVTTAELILGNNISAASATCSPDIACGTSTSSVTLSLSGAAGAEPFKYELSASLRTTAQGQATAANSSAVPLVALNAPAGTSPCPTLTASGTRIVTVIGDVASGSGCAAAPMQPTTTALLQQTGTRRPFAEIADPFIGIPQPTAACGTGANPTPIGNSPTALSTVIYPNAVSISTAVTFRPGRYVFCNGLTFTSAATITGTDVFLFVKAGTFTSSSATVNLSAATTGTYANLLLWVSTANVTLTVTSGPRVSTYRGYTYAPKAAITLVGTGANNFGGIIGRTVAFTGSNRSRVGLPIPTLAISPAAGALPSAQRGAVYAPVTFAATGGTAPYTWSASGVPAGLTLNATTGVLSGTPTTSGSFNSIIVTAFDATRTAFSANYSMPVNALNVISLASLPNGQVGIVYPTTTVTRTGGTSPWRFSATGLPAGLALNANTGVISGSPTQAGSFTVTLTVTDAINATVSRTLTLVVRPALAITPQAMPNGQVGVAYAATTFVGTGGLAPYAWSATGLPAGLTIDPATGVISGTPTTPGVFAVEVSVRDSVSAVAITTSSLTINPPLGIAPMTLVDGQVGVVYPAATWSPTGGTAPYTWTATGLPAGLSLDPATGVMSGSATASGAFTVAVTVIDATLTPSSANFPLTIRAVLAITPRTMPVGSAGIEYEPTTFAATGGLAPYTWAASGLPAGLSMNPATGEISGTPTIAGAYAAVVTAVDAAGATATANSALTVVSSVPEGCPLEPDGWRAEYFSNSSLTGPAFACRDDAQINFDWKKEPIEGMPKDKFSVRWTRTQDFAVGTYTFLMGNNDGARLYVDGELVLDKWYDQKYPKPLHTVALPLGAGSHTIVMEFYARNGSAQATLDWTFVPA